MFFKCFDIWRRKAEASMLRINRRERGSLYSARLHVKACFAISFLTLLAMAEESRASLLDSKFTLQAYGLQGQRDAEILRDGQVQLTHCAIDPPRTYVSKLCYNLVKSDTLFLHAGVADATELSEQRSADENRVNSLWSAAREASAKLDFETALMHLDSALETQVRLYGEADFTTAALLLDMAMILAYQEDFEAAQAIIRRAGVIIDASPRPSDRARLAGYQASIAALQGNFDSAGRYAADATLQWRNIVGSDDNQAVVSLFQSNENDTINVQPELA
ncbi:MAG: tetratricopeptide repeat protein, partial [Sphingomonadaceae bacterium]|nr:tetratricopeptide repeat protein [Sphingomonadaceae bacterium]